MDWLTIITTIVAIYGAILSTYTLMSNRMEKKRQIRVKLSMGLVTVGSQMSPVMLIISAIYTIYKSKPLSFDVDEWSRDP